MLISILKFLILCYDRLYESHKVFVSFYELWGIMKQKEYYTAGELARLFNIPKQTMLYYDKRVYCSRNSLRRTATATMRRPST